MGFSPTAARGLKASCLCGVLVLLEDREQAAHLGTNIYNLPAWVHLSDTRRVKRLNQMEKHVWRFICQFIEKLLGETTEPAVLGANATLQLRLHKVDLGQQPLESVIRFKLKMWTKGKLFCTFRLIL